MGDMTVFLASYLRSGNTFFRVVAHSLFGIKSGDIYDRNAATPAHAGERAVTALMGHSRLDGDEVGAVAGGGGAANDIPFRDWPGLSVLKHFIEMAATLATLRSRRAGA